MSNSNIANDLCVQNISTFVTLIISHSEDYHFSSETVQTEWGNVVGNSVLCVNHRAGTLPEHSMIRTSGGGGGGGEETRSGTEKRCSHNLQSDHPT